MSWPRALVYVLIAGILGTVYFATAPPPPPPPAAAAAEASAPEVAIDSMRLEVGGRTVRATRSDAQWTVVEPATATVPSDLVAALVAAVLETPAQPVTGDADRLADFGLDSPSTRLTFGRPSAPPVTLSLGSANPAETGVYARLEGNPQVILVGLNVRYYIDLILKQSAGL
jgi:hypothetical protein